MTCQRRSVNLGTVAEADGILSFGVPEQAEVINLAISGTFTATVTFQAEVNGSWVNIGGLPFADLVGGAAVTSTTAAGGWQFDIRGKTGFRISTSGVGAGEDVVAKLTVQ